MSFCRGGLAVVVFLVPGLAVAQSSPPAGKPAVATIVEMNAGDVACYVTLRDERGGKLEEMAAFEVCEKKSLVGRKVRLSWRMGNVLGPSCQGDPNCKETIRVPLVVDAVP